MRVYHFIDKKFGLDDLRRRRLKIATLDDLNDPFELLGAASTERRVRKAFQETKSELAKTVGILCFSRNWSNPVQWSHYADKHRGLCLGFDIRDKDLVRVKYRVKRLKSSLERLQNASPAGQAEMLNMLCTKYSQWRYEREERCFVRLRERDKETGLFFAAFSNRLSLKEVIVGHNSDISHDEVRTALGDTYMHVTICKARLAFLSFKIVKQMNDKLW